MKIRLNGGEKTGFILDSHPRYNKQVRQRVVATLRPIPTSGVLQLSNVQPQNEAQSDPGSAVEVVPSMCS